MKKAAALLILSGFASILQGLGDTPLLLRSPALSRTHIVFVYAGDLWQVERGGGQAARLTTGVGSEYQPLFSPDGSQIAFTGEYDGNTDVFIVPAQGGVPRRLTYHPSHDEAVGWSPDGQRVLFVSDRSAHSNRYATLFTIEVNGVFPEELPLPMGYEGSYSPDGGRLAYVPLPRGFEAWKRYRGGMTTKIWIADLSDSGVVPVPRDNSNDFNPMWVGDKIYFLSDREGPVTLFSYDVRSKAVKRLIKNSALDIKSASAGPDAIIYEQFGSLHLYELQSGKTRGVDIRINGDLLSVRSKFEKVGRALNNSGISPSGARAVFEARGEILTVPAEKGDPRNLTNSSGVAERDPAWSPDGRWIAYFSDESGEYALHLRSQNLTGDVTKIGLGTPPSFYYSPTWSPDSRKIAYLDKRLTLWYLDIEQQQPVKIDTLPRATGVDMNWSPDSRWIAFTKPLKSWYSALFVYSLEDGQSRQVTDGFSDVAHPVFDRSGKYIYFSASTNIGPRVFGFDMSSYPHRPTRSVYLWVLNRSLASPLAPESDDEKPKEDEAGASSEQKENGGGKESSANPEKAEAKGKKEPPKVTIDFDAAHRRILALPISERSVTALAAGKENILFVLEDVTPGATGSTLHKFDLKKRKLDKFIDSLNEFEISANAEKILFRQRNEWFIAGTSQTPKPGEGQLKTAELEVRVDPVAEWKQMYRETWRIERDFFYDPSHHGLDLNATSRKYEPYLAGLAHRADLSYLFQEMLGELSVGHLYVSGGDVPSPTRVSVGLLGADYRVENGRYRFARVLDGESWNPDLRAPLAQPGVDVVEGEYLLAVNGRDLTAAQNVYSFFEATASRQVVLRVGPHPDGTDSREVTVVPVASEGELRGFAWVEENRRKVSRMSEGRLAYVYLPNTARTGYAFFNRYFFPQTDKEGIVVDERFNSGGQAADYIVDYLRKPLVSYWAMRDGDDFRTPFGTIPGPKVMLTNEYSGSGGDFLPYMFRRAGLGPLIGKRTWGGLIGIGGYPLLIDGGRVTAPHFAFYTPEGEWQIENYGVQPDIDVELDPKAVREGKDPQLEKAVEWLLAELKKNPPPKPKRPPYPNYHRVPSGGSRE